MNWKLVLAFVGILCAVQYALYELQFLVRAAVGACPDGSMMLPLAHYFIRLIALASIFAALASRQADRVWAHAFAVWAGVQTGFFVLMFPFYGPSDGWFFFWALAGILLLAPLVLGVLVGSRLRRPIRIVADTRENFEDTP